MCFGVDSLHEFWVFCTCLVVGGECLGCLRLVGRRVVLMLSLVVRFLVLRMGVFWFECLIILGFVTSRFV